MCYIEEMNRLREAATAGLAASEEEMKVPDLKKVSGVKFDPENCKFIFDNDFFDIIKIFED